ncbi:hypothetical protein M6D93_04015 [Jatrophihabitans telluris]|uniref:Sensor domain-containing protein n=1 Tax=Jatrophihabitans telluris TaxID=2038343 RepID=A0ABY4R207_9ACTN|nr:hypothetical protein [Jatrophihabitans telluris]UQX89175.1 hypothetical protein M6D93_04015 [Jatrophihabitans telluris]
MSTVRSSWQRRGFWPANLLLLLLAVPVTMAISVALFGPKHPSIGASFGIVGVYIASYVRDRRFWKLAPTERALVRTSMSTGVPTGRPDLDQVALDRLNRSASSWGADRVALPIAGFMLLLVPVVAAFRGSAWWLLSFVPAVILLVLQIIKRRSGDPAQRAASLYAAIGHP